MQQVKESQPVDTLLTAVSAAFGASYPIAFPGLDFEQSGETYLEVSALPNGSAFESVGSGATLQGLLQIAVMYPSNPAPGVIKPLQIAEAVADAFGAGARFFGTDHSVTIPSRPVVAQPFPDDGYIRTPVTISYQATT